MRVSLRGVFTISSTTATSIPFFALPFAPKYAYAVGSVSIESAGYGRPYASAVGLSEVNGTYYVYEGITSNLSANTQLNFDFAYIAD